MAQPTLCTVPRFLLPKISWQAAPASTRCAMRAMSTMQTVRARGSERRNASRPPSMHYTRDIFVAARSPIVSSIQQHRAFSASPINFRDHHFDTLKFVKRMKGEGFTEEQSVAMMRVLSDVIEERYECDFLDSLFPAPSTANTTIASKISHEQWSFERIKLKQHIPKK